LATGAALGSQEASDTVRVDAYNRAVSAAHSAGTDDDTVRRAELSALIQACLGHSIDQQTFDRLANAQARFQIEQARLAERLDAGVLTPEDYLLGLNNRLRRWRDRSRSILGRENFSAIFGEAGEHPGTLVDRETFLNSEEARRS
jgi:hypothetical protein